LTYGENVLAETNNYQLHITEEDLKGLPDGAKEMAQVWQNQNMEGWFYLDFPSYLPFVTYVDNRELRKEIAIAAGKIISRQRIR
jgi:peptidyl-dipeptidase Dcp